MNLLPRILPRTPEQRRAEIERQLIRREAEIGGQLFGPIPKGHSRQFFCLDEYTWIWHEEWMSNGQRNVVNTRYEIRHDEVIKVQNGHRSRLSKAEARHFYKAVHIYKQKVEAAYQTMLSIA